MMRDLLAGLLRPSPAAQTPEQALVRGLAHAVLGAALALALPWWAAVALYAVKEASDLMQGGSWRDGAWDMAHVALGASGWVWWPAAALALALGNAWDVNRNA